MHPRRRHLIGVQCETPVLGKTPRVIPKRALAAKQPYLKALVLAASLRPSALSRVRAQRPRLQIPAAVLRLARVASSIDPHALTRQGTYSRCAQMIDAHREFPSGFLTQPLDKFRQNDGTGRPCSEQRSPAPHVLVEQHAVILGEKGLRRPL